MPNLYVLTGDGITYTVVIHVVIPSVNNLAGINYQTALINSKVPNAGQTVLPVGAGPGQISATDYASLLAGGIY